MRTRAAVRVPASTANLGPGFDCLGMALELWNSVDFSLEGSGVQVDIRGEGEMVLPRDDQNLVVKCAMRLFKEAGISLPLGLRISCQNQIPLGSGLGSSAAATLAGMVGANALLDHPYSRDDILELADEIEGHPDNIAAALNGGLTMVVKGADGLLVRRFTVAPLRVVIALPEFDLPTEKARAVLPRQVSLRDAIFNLGRTPLLVEALRSGDLKLLGQVMDDHLHQPYRLPLIPGAEACVAAARKAGAAAAALSGAGPSVAAFTVGNTERIAAAMLAAFEGVGLPARAFDLAVSDSGSVETI